MPKSRLAFGSCTQQSAMHSFHNVGMGHAAIRDLGKTKRAALLPLSVLALFLDQISTPPTFSKTSSPFASSSIMITESFATCPLRMPFDNSFRILL